MTILTVNADDHSVLSLMRRPEDEKRGDAIPRSNANDEWLHTKNVEVARNMMQLCPAGVMTVEQHGR